MVDLFPTILYSSMIGMTAFALLEISKRPNEKPNLFLKILLVLLLIHLAGELFIFSGAYVYAPALAGAQFPFRILLGPALFFYAHACMSSDQRASKKLQLIALSGPFLVLLAMVPFIFLINPSEKLALADPATRDPALWQIAVLTCLVTTLLFIFYTAFFLFMALKIHDRHRKQLMERFSEIEQNSIDWIRSIIFIWGSIWFLFALEFSLSALGWRWIGTATVLPILEVVALAMFIQHALRQKLLSPSEKVSTATPQIRTALLDSKRMEQIASKLKYAMKDDRLFLQDDLSLNKLSEAIAESENHISETLSQFLSTNFFQFVNSYRIEAAQQALRETNKQVMSIAFDVGFSSKSTFNTAFKKIVGHSPSAYRKLELEKSD